jgi:hypothetical protein
MRRGILTLLFVLSALVALAASPARADPVSPPH